MHPTFFVSVLAVELLEAFTNKTRLNSYGEQL